MLRILLSAATALVLAGAHAGSDDAPAYVAGKHLARIDGRTLTYNAEAGRLPIRDMESGQIRARMFYAAYRVPPHAADKPRPVVFSWGGGPSGPALGEQMAYGPKTVTREGNIVDNDLSLLTSADLVFVDPVGTGFSRPEQPGTADEFYSTTGDARSVAEFVRVWIATHDAETAPLFLNGQSYGVWRAAIVSELLEQSGRRVAGIIITSGGMGLADEYADRAFQVALRIPDYAATAFHHGRLPPGFASDAREAWQKAEKWARETYGPALSRVDKLSDTERETVAADLARYTGYPLDRIDRQTLVFMSRQFRSDLLGDGDRSLNLFDMRRTGDAVDDTDTSARSRGQARYLREALSFRTDLAYLGLEPGYIPVTGPDYQSIGWRWKYDTGGGKPPTDGGPPGKEPWVRRAIDINPALQVFVEATVYDSLNYCAANEDRKRRMPADLADNFELHCYFAGHGSFRDPASHPLLVRDIRNFIDRVAK